jgi:hypothetical protein
MHIPIRLVEQVYTFVSEERISQDLIFNSRDLLNRSSLEGYAENDKDYRKPDREQYIFSTMGTGLITLYSNNMIASVRTKDTLNGYHMYSEINKLTGAKEPKNGVYIVDYYTMFNNYDTSIETIIQHYLNNSALDYDVSVIEGIRKQINSHKSVFRPPTFRIRLVTFIPEDEIRTKGFVYVSTSDVVIAKGMMSSKLMHPNSTGYKNSAFRAYSYKHNVLHLEVVDNHSSDPYYIKIGNNVETIFPTRDDSRKSGGALRLSTNNVDMVTRTSDLNGLANDLGIYRDPREAEANGSIDKITNLEKLKLDKEKIELEYHKIEREKERLLEEKEFLKSKYEFELKLYEQKFKLIDLDIVKKYNEATLGMHKFILELNQSKTKFERERLQSMEKHKHELNKLAADNIRSNIDMSTKLITSSLGIINKLI